MSPLQNVIALLTERIGLDAGSLGTRHISNAVHSRMKACGLTSSQRESASSEQAARYLEILSRDENEFHALVDEIVVPESWFFRDLRPFERLQSFAWNTWLPRREKCLRILSIPCARGEEAYALAIALLEIGLAPARFHVEAVDISPRALGWARRGVYGSGSFRRDQIGERSRYFREHAEGFEIQPAVRNQVEFRQGNLLTAATFAENEHFDVIFCRNLLIYLTGAAREQAIARLDALLQPGGMLFVGHAEAVLLHREPFQLDPDQASFALVKTAGTAAARPGPKKTRTVRAAAPRKSPPPPERITPAPAQPVPVDKLQEALKLANLKEHDRARTLCEEVLRERGPSAPLFHLMGMIELEAGRVHSARDYLAKAVYLDPMHEEAHLTLASLAQRSGDSETARLHQRRARHGSQVKDKK